MSLFWLIIIIILVWIATPIIKVWRKVRRFQDEYTRTMNSGGQQGPSAPQGRQRSEEQQEIVERYRRYSDATAENVDFEELEGHITESDDTSLNNGPTTRYQEEDVSDAEFEEIG